MKLFNDCICCTEMYSMKIFVVSYKFENINFSHVITNVSCSQLVLLMVLKGPLNNALL